PHIDQLVHWHDTVTSLTGEMCREEGYSFPTWSAAYYQQQKQSGNYDGVYELDFGISAVDNPIQRMYEAVGLPEETYSNYQIYLTNADKAVAESVLRSYPKPRIVLLEGIEGTTTRGWDPGKVSALEQAIKREYGVEPIWFGGTYTPFFEGRPLTLRENIATLAFCDVGIGVMSGPMHFAAAVGLPTITLFCDQPLHRAAPAYFLNQYRKNSKELHRTLLGPTNPNMKFLKEGTTQANLTPEEWKSQRYRNWTSPGRQATKSCLAVITVDEVMMVLREALAS
ncbi:MAG: glycosyltransferase family 9 protein, partial [Acidobacteriota bacterium]